MHTDTAALVLRAARAAVRDHAPADLLARDYSDPKDRCWELRTEREYPARDDQRVRSLADALSTAEVLGYARDLDHPRFARDLDREIVVRITYAQTWCALYAVAPDHPAVCWAD